MSCGLRRMGSILHPFLLFATKCKRKHNNYQWYFRQVLGLYPHKSLLMVAIWYNCYHYGEHKSHPSRAGLVGFICFVVLGGLLLSPVLPGKIFDSFPGSSQSLSTGDDSPACIHELEAVSSALSYNRKLGSPITYSYATTTTQKATCDGKQQTAIAGRAGQFNPLGLLIDSALALIVSVIVSKVWRRVFHEQN